jgi:hypothetical protein
MNRKVQTGKVPRQGIETLQSDPAYHLIYKLGFQDMVPFVMQQIKRKGLFSWLYATVNLTILAFIIIYAIVTLFDHSLGWKSLLIQFALGAFSGSILVIPVHELLHGLAYRILGAKKIIFGADLSQFIFFVTAKQYVVSGREIHLLTLAPFVIINLFTIGMTLWILPHWIFFSGVFLLSHNIMCIGDFATSNFVSKAKGRIYNYDEPEYKLSYFFEEL